MSQIYQNQNWRPLHIRDTFLFERGNVKGFATQGGETGTSEVIGPNSNPGAFPDTPFVIGVYSCFGEAAQPGNIRSLDVEHLFNFGATTDITANQSIVAVRGAQTHAEGTAFGSGTNNEYSYGVQGKEYVATTINIVAGFLASLFGQLDTSNAAAAVTSGYVSALHLDMGSTSHLSSSSYINAETVTNTTQCLINSVLKVIANASALFDLAESNLTGNWILASSVNTGDLASVKLKVKVNGTTYYLPLYTA